MTMLWEVGQNDADGKAFLNGNNIRQFAIIDTTHGSFGNPTTMNHYGAARDGYFYSNGVRTSADNLDFGIGTTPNDVAWLLGKEDPLGATLSGIGTQTYTNSTCSWTSTSDGSGVSRTNVRINSFHKWRLAGNFDVQCEYYDFPTSSNYCIFLLQMYSRTQNTSDYVVVARMRSVRDGINHYYRECWNAGGMTNNANEGTTHANGIIRLTRVNSTFAGYYWTGAAWDKIGGDFAATNVGTSDICVQLAVATNNSTVSGKFCNFKINSGTVVYQATWASEAAGDHRGSRSDMPETMAVVLTDTAINLIDVVNNKMWMRFNMSTTNLLKRGSGASYDSERPWKISWNNGRLFVSCGTTRTAVDSGNGFVIDFTMDAARTHRATASTITGGRYRENNNQSEISSKGVIYYRNSGNDYGGDDNTWQSPAYRHYAVDTYQAADNWEYRVFGTSAGLAVFKKQIFYYITNSPDVSDCASSTKNIISYCQFDQSNGDIYCFNTGSIYQAKQATYEAAFSGGTFAYEKTKATVGTFSTDTCASQQKLVKIGNQIYYCANEGIYTVDWTTTDNFSLIYGKVGSAATYPIMEDYDSVDHIEKITYLGFNYLVVATTKSGVYKLYLIALTDYIVCDRAIPSNTLSAQCQWIQCFDDSLTAYVAVANGVDVFYLQAQTVNDACSRPIIGADFTLNHYVCLGNQYNRNSLCSTSMPVPYAMGPRGINLRMRTTPSSGSIGFNSKQSSPFDYGNAQRKKEERLQEQQEIQRELEKQK